MRRIADVARNYGSGELRLTVWQNLILPDIPDGFVETVKRSLIRIGLHYEATSITGGIIACTGNTGCKFAMTNTKGQGVELARYLDKKLHLDQPINIHLTGCPNSCAQHYIGDIGLLATKVDDGGESEVEGYHLVVGGGSGADLSLGREIARDIAAEAGPRRLESMLRGFLARREAGE